jgi:ankyrin repeat protein
MTPSRIKVQDCGCMGLSRRNNIIEHWSAKLLQTSRLGQVCCVNSILREGLANINATDRYGWTPLLLATEKGHYGTVEVLLQASNLNVNAKAPSGETPLILASMLGHKRTVDI